MKTGILTFFCAHNYGAVLQAYALQEYLLGLGHDAGIIDYRPEYLTEPYKIFSRKRCKQPTLLLSVKVLLGECSRLPRRYKKYKAFGSFINRRLRLLKLDLNDPESDIDVFVFGSDQIWSSEISGGLDHVFLGNFNAAGGKKLIAYAASAGKDVLNETETAQLKKALQSFTAIGVREAGLQETLQQLTHKPVCHVLDPTLLVTRDVFERIAVEPPVKQPYVLIYQVSGKASELFQLAAGIAKEIKAVVLEMASGITEWKKREGQIECASPEAFIGYFKHAHCVVTSSFHGTAFSVIFQKPFYTLRLNIASDERFVSLLEKIGLSDRMFERDALPCFSPIDYKPVTKKLNDIREGSKSFLEALVESVSNS
jgi:hypothetical protein